MQTSTKQRIGRKTKVNKNYNDECTRNEANRLVRRGKKINLKKYPKLIDRRNDVR